MNESAESNMDANNPLRTRFMDCNITDKIITNNEEQNSMIGNFKGGTNYYTVYIPNSNLYYTHTFFLNRRRTQYTK